MVTDTYKNSIDENTEFNSKKHSSLYNHPCIIPVNHKPNTRRKNNREFRHIRHFNEPIFDESRYDIRTRMKRQIPENKDSDESNNKSKSDFTKLLNSDNYNRIDIHHYIHIVNEIQPIRKKSKPYRKTARLQKKLYKTKAIEKMNEIKHNTNDEKHIQFGESVVYYNLPANNTTASPNNMFSEPSISNDTQK